MLRLSLLLLLLLLNPTIEVWGIDTYSRADFPPPPGFVFGSGTSAYQVEGAADQDGRTPSIWDTFVHAGYRNGATGDVACDGYHKYKEDVQLMVETGLEAYRFSISWSRLIPNGKGPVNPKGLQFYNNFINELILHGIEPHVTIHHFDPPQALEDEYGGWLDRKIVEDFTAYADICFREFGDRVLYWTTINEPNAFALYGYDQAFLPPMRCSFPFGFLNCSKGNSTTEPYIVAHHILLAHASAAKLYREKYLSKQHGFIGLNLLGYWSIPLTNKKEDAIAAQRANDFFLGWFVHPLVFGQYPEIMIKNAGPRIPAFTSSESELVKGSFDFLGLNFYAVLQVKDNPGALKVETRDLFADVAAQIAFPFLPGSNKNAYEFPILPWALQELLEYFKQDYGNPTIYIHENGQPTERNSTLQDWVRVKTMHGYIGGLLDAIRNGSNTRGYFTWSFLDVFEVLDGYETGFGLYYVDLDDPSLKREAKLSAKWYSEFFKGNKVRSDGTIELKNITVNRPQALSFE